MTFLSPWSILNCHETIFNVGMFPYPGCTAPASCYTQLFSLHSFTLFNFVSIFSVSCQVSELQTNCLQHSQIQSVASPDLCVDTRYKHHGERFGLEECGHSGEQSLHLTWHRDIRPGRRSVCWDVSSGDPRAPVLLYNCHGMGGNQLWRYDPVSDYLDLSLFSGDTLALSVLQCHCYH